MPDPAVGAGRREMDTSGYVWKDASSSPNVSTA
jgi:hypothetical protein